eukprot:6940020-Pyramimonas_sp.AAC.1
MLQYCEQIPLVLLEHRGRKLNSDPVWLGVCLVALRPAGLMALRGVVALALCAEFRVVVGRSMAAPMI